LSGSTGTLLFRYVLHSQAHTIAEGLARQGILVRQFDGPPALRFGLPGTSAAWQRLDSALTPLSDLIDQKGAHC
ncbi:MAG: hypothetical protein WED11_02150, partial [Natronospirillum sp.]